MHRNSAFDCYNPQLVGGGGAKLIALNNPGELLKSRPGSVSSNSSLLKRRSEIHKSMSMSLPSVGMSKKLQ